MPNAPRLAVLVSGKGTLLEAMIQNRLPISLVIADRPCRGLDIAIRSNIIAELIRRPHSELSDQERDAYTIDVCRKLLEFKIDVVAIAGFMTIFSSRMFDHYAGLLLNSHPSLLPSFPGNHPVRDALTHGVKVTGTTIHIATEELDAGPILAQSAVPVLEGDTEETLHERIKKVERVLYPHTIREFMARPIFNDERMAA